MTPHPIRVRRAELGMTMQDLHHATGLQMSTLSNIETRKSRPRIETLYKIAAALQTTIRYLVEEEAK